jgi:hypothetical protein
MAQQSQTPKTLRATGMGDLAQGTASPTSKGLEKNRQFSILPRLRTEVDPRPARAGALPEEKHIRRKAVRNVARIHEQIKVQRKELTHRVSRKLLERFDLTHGPANEGHL